MIVAKSEGESKGESEGSPLTSPDTKNTHGTTVKTQIMHDHDTPTSQKSEDVSSTTLAFATI